MSKKVILFLIAIIFFSSCRLANASLMINEVMYDLSGSDSTNSKSREWIEIYNPDASDVAIDASKWRIYDGSGNRTINGETDFSIPAHSYIIFAGDKDTFLVDNPSFGGVVYDTGITSLNNTAGTLKILDQDGNTVDLFAYTSSLGGAGDGNSLQKISGSWSGGTPTPGATNENSTASASSSGGTGALVNNSTSNDNNSSVQSANTTRSNTAEEPKIKTQIVAPNLVFVNMPLSFRATTLGYNKEKIFYGKYFWNFGDGDSKEIQVNDFNNGQFLTHTYFYPGEYAVSLAYYMNSYSDTPDALDKMTVTVVPADILISKVGDLEDFFVELTNNTNYDADISNWALSSTSKSFTFPKNTVISTKKKMTISSQLTNFTVEDKNTLKLFTPQGRVVSDYSVSALPVARVVSETAKQDTMTDPAQVSDLPIIPTDDLGASASSSDAAKDSPISYPSVLAVGFIAASAGAVYFIRQRKIVYKAGDDFKILDE